MSRIVKLYHGSGSIVRAPDLGLSREDVDFGKGFYMSRDYVTSAKWACNKATSICNQFELDLDGLVVHEFALDQDWLEFVSGHRNGEELTDHLAKINEADVIIGAIADDKLFHTLELYADGMISPEKAIQVMNCMDYGLQYVIKTEKAKAHLRFIAYEVIIGAEKEEFKRMYHADKKEATRRTELLLKSQDNKEHA